METYLKSNFPWIVGNYELILYCVFGFVVLLLIVALVISYFQIRKWKKWEEEAHNQWLKYRDDYITLKAADEKTVLALSSEKADHYGLKILYEERMKDYDFLIIRMKGTEGYLRMQVNELKAGLRLKAVQQAIVACGTKTTGTGLNFMDDWRKEADKIYSYLLGK
jgi:hypothetical protein